MSDNDGREPKKARIGEVTSKPRQSKPKFVRVNVGGKRFEVLPETLMNMGDMLKAYAARWKDADTGDDELYLDRDPKEFQYLLEYGRTFRLVLARSVNLEEFLSCMEGFWGMVFPHFYVRPTKNTDQLVRYNNKACIEYLALLDRLPKHDFTHGPSDWNGIHEKAYVDWKGGYFSKKTCEIVPGYHVYTEVPPDTAWIGTVIERGKLHVLARPQSVIFRVVKLATPDCNFSAYNFQQLVHYYLPMSLVKTALEKHTNLHETLLNNGYIPADDMIQYEKLESMMLNTKDDEAFLDVRRNLVRSNADADSDSE